MKSESVTISTVLSCGNVNCAVQGGSNLRANLDLILKV